MIRSTIRIRSVARLGAAVLAVSSFAACERFEPEYVDSLNFQPDSIFLEPGQSGTFTAVPISQTGTELPDRTERVEFTISGSASQIIDAQPSVGSITVTAKALGSVPVRARLGRGDATGLVHVVPAGLATVQLSVPSINISTNQTVGVQAILLDSNGNQVSHEGHRISWRTGDTNVARVAVINTNLVSTSVRGVRPGSTALILTVSGRTVSIPVTVR